MADRLRFHPLVASDLRDAIAWYDEISVELGNRFRETVDARFDHIVGVFHGAGDPQKWRQRLKRLSGAGAGLATRGSRPQPLLP